MVEAISETTTTTDMWRCDGFRESWFTGIGGSSYSCLHVGGSFLSLLPCRAPFCYTRRKTDCIQVSLAIHLQILLLSHFHSGSRRKGFPPPCRGYPARPECGMRTADLLLLSFLSETKDRVSFVSSFSDVASKALSTLIMDERGTGRYFWPCFEDGHNLIVLASLFHFDTIQRAPLGLT